MNILPYSTSFLVMSMFPCMVESSLLFENIKIYIQRFFCVDGEEIISLLDWISLPESVSTMRLKVVG